MFIVEPSKVIDVINEADICVIGGSCTGVFAAVSAARLGAKVIIVERHNSFGGMATAGMVNVWHSLFDNRNEKQIIAGLTQEIIDRLGRRDAVISKQNELPENNHNAYVLNTEELKIELDELIKESRIIPYLNTYFVGLALEDSSSVDAVIIENKNGRKAIKAKLFIDASGDGDLARRMGLGFYSYDTIQPPTMCARLYGMDTFGDTNWRKMIDDHRDEFGLQKDWGWGGIVPEMPKITFNAETHVFNAQCGDADVLTFCEMEGRRQIRAYIDILRKYKDEKASIALASLGSSIGIRDTYHIKCNHKLLGSELLGGHNFDDAIGYGSYCVDIHNADSHGNYKFRYLDGTEISFDHSTSQKKVSKWGNVPTDYRPYYEIPYSSLVPENSKNVIVAGRMLDSDEEAFGGIRVMVNLNQTGEAAGTAAYLALNSDMDFRSVRSQKLRDTMKRSGSIMI